MCIRDSYPSVPDFWYDDDIEGEVEPLELEEVVIIADDSKGDDVLQPTLEDPAEKAETYQVDPADLFEEDELETEVVVEVIPAASGCHQTDKKGTFWKLFGLLLLMYALGGIFGWLAAIRNEN